MDYLLCINDSGLAPNNPVKLGFTFTKREEIFCGCGKGDRLVTVDEVRWKDPNFVQTCIACGAPLNTGGHVAMKAERFQTCSSLREALRIAETLPRRRDDSGRRAGTPMWHAGAQFHHEVNR